MDLLLNIAYRQDNIPRTVFDDIVEGMKTGGRGRIVFLAIGLIAIIFLLNVVANRKKYLPKSETVKYLYGYPSFDGIKEGIIEITAKDLIFKEFADERIFFTIPLEQITTVFTEHKPLSALTYFAIGLAGIATERNYLIVKFRRDGIDHSVKFSAQRESCVIDKLKCGISEAITNRSLPADVPTNNR